MSIRSALSHVCEIAGRASAIVMLVGLGSFAFAATAFDILH